MAFDFLKAIFGRGAQTVKYLPSQVDLGSKEIPYPYTEGPWKLVLYDLKLFFRYRWALPTIMFPLSPTSSAVAKRWDELYPSPANLFCMGLHMVLIFMQMTFLLSLPLCLFAPIPFFVLVAGVIVFSIINWSICRVINGGQPTLYSQIPLPDPYKSLGDQTEPYTHDGERWFYQNGVSVGHYWLQQNLDRLAVTFRRNVTGVHNATKGILFDLIECIIQRDFDYDTMSVRNTFKAIKKELLDPTVKKVVFILHSQGGIEGGLILDWLLADAPRQVIQKLEIYTFGNAANHFNNPDNAGIEKENLRALIQSGRFGEEGTRVLRHIEHYANTFDFVADFGVINFTEARDQAENQFAGALYQQNECGHMLNQHYLASMFPLESPYGPVEKGRFMNAIVEVQDDVAKRREERPSPAIAPGRTWSISTKMSKSLANKSDKEIVLPSTNGDGVETPSIQVIKYRLEKSQNMRVFERSRLWQYRNGLSPED